MNLPTCVSPVGTFVTGIHRPSFMVVNLREHIAVMPLGMTGNNLQVTNQSNFPEGNLTVESADWIYEVANPFPFRGTTYINRAWAETKAENPSSIRLPPPAQVSFRESCSCRNNSDQLTSAITALPRPLQLALATTSTDPEDLRVLAALSCEFCANDRTRPTGLRYATDKQGKLKPVVHDHELFEAVANNPSLPDNYKEVMVLRPGAQGTSEIVGEWIGEGGESHVFEYLRRNSYIPWGHYASNMANDSVRYTVADLTWDDITGLRHLYAQRTFVRVASMLELPEPPGRHLIAADALEALRLTIMRRLPHATPEDLPLNATLWGWNYGFDYAPSLYRLHASHQQIHQQFALIPRAVVSAEHEASTDRVPSYACGDLIARFAEEFRQQTKKSFFDCYLAAICGNRRLDGREDRKSSLIIHQDDNVMLFVPKAQTSQWELQLLCIKPVGNILEANQETRASLDHGIFIAMKALTGLGAKMITTIEFSKRFDTQSDQRLLYSFLPKLPESPGAFSEAQLRFINGHYPEDFATCCRQQVAAMGLALSDRELPTLRSCEQTDHKMKA